MKRRSLILLVCVLSCGGAALAAGYWWFSRGGQSTPGGDSTAGGVEGSSAEPVATVTVVPVKEGRIATEIAAYGTIVPAAGALQTVSVPFESQVGRVLVTQADEVSSGDALLEIEPSPDTKLQAQQARNDYESARQGLDYMQQRFDLKLATNDQLLQAKQVLDQARSKLHSIERRGVDGNRTLRADSAGLIAKVPVEEGAIVPAGNSLMEIVVQNRLEARLNVEPEDIDRVDLDQDVSLARVNVPDSAAVIGRIRKISHAVNTATRLVDVFVNLPSSAEFLLGEYIQGKIAVASKTGLIVPRSAVLPEEDHYVIFTVKDGRAVKHPVRIGLQDETTVEVTAEGLGVGDLVVTLGNYELRQGMAVTTTESR